MRIPIEVAVEAGGPAGGSAEMAEALVVRKDAGAVAVDVTLERDVLHDSIVFKVRRAFIVGVVFVRRSDREVGTGGVFFAVAVGA